jgi:type I restriction enzyme, S subunit
MSKWKDSTLNEYITFKNGRSSPARVETGKLPVYGSNGIIGYSDEKNSHSNSLIIGRVGSYCGCIYHSDSDCWVTDNAIIGLPNEKGESEFWYYVLSQLNLNNYRSGSGQPLLNQRTLNSISVSVPDSSLVRSRIGRYLMAFDDKIKLNTQINRTLESITQTIFQSWFVDFDPVKAKMDGREPEGVDVVTAALFPNRLVDSELGMIPEGWGREPLYDTADYINGASFKEVDFTGKGIPIIKITELKKGLSDQTKYTEKTFDSKYRIQDDDILYSWSGSPETSLEVFKWFGGLGWLNQHIFKVTTSSIEQKYYVYNLLRQINPKLIEIAKNKQTTGLGHVTVKDMKRMLLPTPGNDIVQAYARIVGSMYEMGSSLMKEINTLVLIRDTLLPKLISGEVRL